MVSGQRVNGRWRALATRVATHVSLSHSVAPKSGCLDSERGVQQVVQLTTGTSHCPARHPTSRAGYEISE